MKRVLYDKRASITDEDIQLGDEQDNEYDHRDISIVKREKASFADLE